MSVGRTVFVRPPTNLHVQASPYTSASATTLASTNSSPSTSSSTLSGLASSSSTSVNTHSSSALLTVLCLHDFTTHEEHALPFRRGELLEVVKMEESGWWAAMRKGVMVVGWIPKAFVKPLTPGLADRLRDIREDLRPQELEQAEHDRNSSPVRRAMNSIDSGLNRSLPPSYRQTNNQSPRPSSPRYLPRTKSRDTVSGHSQAEVEPTLLKLQRGASTKKSLPPPPPSPTSPMPLPPPLSAPLYTNKPVPPIPREHPSETRVRASSLSSNKSVRRRPLLPTDHGLSPLGQLAPLLEPKGAREIDEIAISDVTGSFQAFATSSRFSPSRVHKSQIFPSTHRAQTHDHSRNLQGSFQLQERPWYILPGHAEELEIDRDGQIRSGSLLGLVERLTSNLVFSTPTSRDPFSSIFLMTFRTFTTSEELFDLLLDRFSMTRPDNLNELEVDDWKRRCLIPTQRHVLDVFTLWLEEHRLLEEDLHIAQRLPDFIRHVAIPRLPAEGQALLQNIERLTFADPIRCAAGVIPKKPLKLKDHKNDLLRVDPAVLADQLTLYEYNLYELITPSECLAYINKHSDSDIKHLSAFCSTYDKLARWVKTSILSQDGLTKRSNTIDHWIRVAERCRANSNFSSMSAILTALSSVVITRLDVTWIHVGRKTHLDALLKYNEPNGGFSAFRNLLSQVERATACVPFVTMYLSDLLRIREQYQDQPDRISFIQRQRWHDTIRAMLKFQRRQSQLIYDDYITTFVKGMLKTFESGPDDDAWLWSKSEDVRKAERDPMESRKVLESSGL